jgi:hypothetical protein
MLSAEHMTFIIARCGGYFKPSILEGLVNPRSYLNHLRRHGELLPLVRRYRGCGEYIYYLPRKHVTRWWRYGADEANENNLFKSFAYLLHYKRTGLLPSTKELFTQQFPNMPNRTFNGVNFCKDEEQGHVCFVLDNGIYLQKINRIVKEFSSDSNFFNIHILTYRGEEAYEKYEKTEWVYASVHIYTYKNLKILF